MRQIAQDYLRHMYESGLVEGLGGVPVKIDHSTRISREQGLLLNQIAKQPTVTKSLEIGFAYGFSTIYILEGLLDKEHSMHLAIDPFEDGHWKGVGAQVVKKLGYEKFHWEKDYSIHSLSEKIKQNDKFDMIYIDGNHRFDDILVDFYLSDQILNVGGFLILDDMWMKSTQLVAKFINRNRDYIPMATNVRNVAVFCKKADDSRNWDHFVDFCSS